MVIKHGTADCFFVLCWNAAILSFHFILTKFQIKGNYLLGHCLVPVDLLILKCNVSNRSSSVLCLTKRKKGKILSTTWRTSTMKKTSWRKFFRTVPRNLNAFLREFMRMRVEWCNIMSIFTFICKLEYIRIWPCSAVTKFSISERYYPYVLLLFPFIYAINKCLSAIWLSDSL